MMEGFNPNKSYNIPPSMASNVNSNNNGSSNNAYPNPKSKGAIPAIRSNKTGGSTKAYQNSTSNGAIQANRGSSNNTYSNSMSNGASKADRSGRSNKSGSNNGYSNGTNKANRGRSNNGVGNSNVYFMSNGAIPADRGNSNNCGGSNNTYMNSIPHADSQTYRSGNGYNANPKLISDGATQVDRDSRSNESSSSGYNSGSSYNFNRNSMFNSTSQTDRGNNSVYNNGGSFNTSTNVLFNGGISQTDQLLAGLLDSFPIWNINDDAMPNEPLPTPPPPPSTLTSLPPPTMTVFSSSNDYYLNNFWGFNVGKDPPPADFELGTISKFRQQPAESSSSSSISCGCCGDSTATIRCNDCNEFMCNDCQQREHNNDPLNHNHNLHLLPAPIGTSPTGRSTVHVPIVDPMSSLYSCDMHGELFGYVCDSCLKLVCQGCTLQEHKDHHYTPIPIFIEQLKHKVMEAISSGNVGTKCVKSGIDKALAFIRFIERNSAEVSENIRKAFRQYTNAIEERERQLLEYVEKMRLRRLASLNDQMAGLKSALSGIAETMDVLQKVSANASNMDTTEVAMKVTGAMRQLGSLAGTYKDLQPRQELLGFISPDFTIISKLRTQGNISVTDQNRNLRMMDDDGLIFGGEGLILLNDINNAAAAADLNITLSNTDSSCGMAANAYPSHRPFLDENFCNLSSPNSQQMHALGGGPSSNYTGGALDWDLGNSHNRCVSALQFGPTRVTQTVPNTAGPVRATRSNTLSLSFATEGHDEGQVSRPWGLCVDRMGNVLISDRRNNRVQVFRPDGVLKFKFGRKGVGNGEFDLPAGICVDTDNRIIVVDKDNHRVQLFTSNGVFLSKFGSYGKEYGQFQYPWDAASNARRQIVVTDSRNHRIQQFDSEGRFIRQMVFDLNGIGKSIASPRGICYTPTGNVIVSDFDNHCLYLIDPEVNKIISIQGSEGDGLLQFNRPSGVCCDDDGRIIVADSKNQRVTVFNSAMNFLWNIDIRPSVNPMMPKTNEERDRTCDVALMPDGRIVFLIELAPDSKEGSNPYKRFVHVF